MAITAPKIALLPLFRHIVLFTTLLLLATGIMWPLPLQLTTGIPGLGAEHEGATFVWNMWWVRHAVVNLHSNPLQTNYIMPPFNIDLRMHTFGLLPGLLSIPLQPFLGPIGAFNLLTLLSLAANGYAMALLARYIWRNDKVAVAVAIFVVTSPAIFQFNRVGKPWFVAIWPIALALFFLLRLTSTTKWRDAWGLGLALIAAYLLDFQILLYTVLWLGLMGLYLLVKQRHLLLRRVFIFKFAFALALAAIPFTIVFLPVLLSGEALGYIQIDDESTIPYSYRFYHYLMPVILQWSIGLVVATVTLMLAITRSSWRQSALWLFGGLFFVILSWGIRLQPTVIPLPFLLLRNLPGLSEFRTPARFSIPATMGLSMAAGGVFVYWGAKLPSRWHWGGVFLLAVVCVIVLRLTNPMGIQTYPYEPIYAEIRQQSGDFVVVEAPLGITTGLQKVGTGEWLQIHQTIHQKRGVNGMIGRVPEHYFEPYQQRPFLQLLAGEPLADDEVLVNDLNALLQEWHIGYIILHKDMLSAMQIQQIDTVLAVHKKLMLVQESNTLRVYRVQ